MRPGSLWAVLLLCCATPAAMPGQEPGRAPADSTLESAVEAGEAATEPPKRRLVRWNEFDGKFMTVRLGGGFLVDYATYAQDDASREQFDLEPAFKVRDARILLKGRIKTRRPVTWSMGIMYDGVTESWLFRETGIMVAVPELRGHVFIGRTKEGFSLNKVMVGYAGWTMERFTFTDATIPILADGIKWLGYLPDQHLLWNIGYFVDWLSEGQGFSSYDHQFVARIAWVPVVSEADRTVVHIGLNGRTGKANGGELQLRSRPEANPAPYFIDTGKFPAQSSNMAGFEAYVRKGPWLLGSEYYYQKVDSPETGDPLFHGGDVALTWLVTGETRTYNTVGGFFKAVSPARTVFEGGPGAVEAVLRLSYSDLDGGTLRGGKFWRITPMVNWHLSDNVRLELAYGYGSLDRFATTGRTQFFQTRLQTNF